MYINKTIRALTCVLLVSLSGAEQAATASGPLRVHPDNPRYFTDDSGKAILLTGAHTWNNLVDMGPTDPPTSFDYKTYLGWLKKHHLNFFRLWTWELSVWNTRGVQKQTGMVHHVWPQAWKRTGPGNALDGKPKFNLRQLNENYFSRLRDRVKGAQDQGLYPSVMLFEGWGIQFCPDGWRYHPFNAKNNSNGIDGDLDHDGRGLEVHSGRSAEIIELQRNYVRKVIDTVNEFDNVLYEISNENHPASTEWQYGMIRFIKRYERSKPKQHPVGMTFQYKGGSNKTLFDSPADWISPNPVGGYRDNPPSADGAKVIITDTDHLWGIGGNPAWVWKSFLRGMNPIFMDSYKGNVLPWKAGPKWAKPIRKSLGYVHDWSRRVDLAAMTPQGNLASSRYCLANRGTEYLVYAPDGNRNVALELPQGRFVVVWFDTTSGKETPEQRVTHSGGKRQFQNPIKADSLLYVRRMK